MISIGFDIGSSSIKCSLWDLSKNSVVATGHYPAQEMEILSPFPGWAEQHPELWWEYLVLLTRKLLSESGIRGDDVGAIGIAYQMHGLVAVDASGTVLRPAIIWCDSRAVEIGENAFRKLGKEFCLSHLLNSPGNFTASKLRWMKEHEPEIYHRIHKIMLPGDYVAMKLTGEISTTVGGLSEGIFWDYTRGSVSSELLDFYEIDKDLLPEVRPTFSVQGRLSPPAASQLGLPAGIPIAYRAGDQPNNAFSLNVLKPGEIAATAGTSGVVYAVTDSLVHDPFSRINVFTHVNYTKEAVRLGILLCINGTGILNSWLRRNVTPGLGYDEMNALASKSPAGSRGLLLFPFGNGAERMLSNATVGSHLAGLDFNRHGTSDVLRAGQEGIAFSFRYGVDILRDLGVTINVVRAGKSNLFLSPLFSQTLATVLGASIELYDTDGAQGAARGAALGSGMYHAESEAFDSFEKKAVIHPDSDEGAHLTDVYQHWCSGLKNLLNNRDGGVNVS